MNNNDDDWSDYLDHIGLFFFFVGCAGVSIIVWIFNWVCWLNQCCFCDFLHNPVNKTIAWWISFSFLLGVLACCISAFVSVNRFGFALDGARCAFDRIYYDSLFAQLKKKGEKWEGFIETSTTLTNIENFCSNVINNGGFPQTNEELKNSYDILKEYCLKDTIKVENEKKYKYKLPRPSSLDSETFRGLKGKMKWDYFQKQAAILNYFLKILSMIYYCLFLIAITAAGVSMMFFACLKRRGYLITFMHILWNIIRFFIFSFFLYGTAYGIFFLILRDLIACMKLNFKENSIYVDENNNKNSFLYDCLFEKKTKFLNETIKTSLIDFFTINQTFYKTDSSDENKPNWDFWKTIFIYKDDNNPTKENNICDFLNRTIIERDGILGSFDCGFLKSDLHRLYKTLYDASTESRILSALSLSSSFFGAIAVYFYLLVIHHYNNELFFDSGKSIFTGFDGFGKGYTKKNYNQDPAYKKRKLRAEIELTSKNDEEIPSKNHDDQ